MEFQDLLSKQRTTLLTGTQEHQVHRRNQGRISKTFEEYALRLQIIALNGMVINVTLVYIDAAYL